jgi:hypothetical protein
MIHRREAPRWLTSSSTGPQNFVATTTSSRRPLSASVAVGSVDEIDAGVERSVNDGDALPSVGVPQGPEHHRAERVRGHLDAGAAECAVLHGGLLLWIIATALDVAVLYAVANRNVTPVSATHDVCWNFVLLL